MTRLYLNDRGLYATGPDNPPGYTVPPGHVCDGCGIGRHVFPEPYHVETCAKCSAVIEREGTEWVHRDGGGRHCWPHGERQPRATVATPACDEYEVTWPDGSLYVNRHQQTRLTETEAKATAPRIGGTWRRVTGQES